MFDVGYFKNCSFIFSDLWGVRMSGRIDELRRYREAMNDLILRQGDKKTRRFFALDHSVYEDGVIDRKTKELMGLLASLVLRCNDCVFYHLDQCDKSNVSDEELMEVLNIALVVGGSVVIPHVRYVFEIWDELKKKRS